tara:strand:- start:293 stop:661 length:369 start_codon:yes stop_codon:yes gene_type:complete
MIQTVTCLIPEQNPQITFKALRFDCPVTSKTLHVYMIEGHLWLAESDLPTGYATATSERFPAFMKGWNTAEVVDDGKSVTMVSYHVVGFLKKLPQPGMRAFAYWLEEFVIPEVSNYLMENAA